LFYRIASHLPPEAGGLLTPQVAFDPIGRQVAQADGLRLGQEAFEVAEKGFRVFWRAPGSSLRREELLRFR